MKAGYLDKQGANHWMEMGCYGIGLSRTLQALVEQSHDEKGMIWPSSVSPFLVHICALDFHSSQKVREASQKIYNFLKTQRVDVFLDDRKEAPGVKFKDADLLGFPVRITVGERDLKQNQVEVSFRKAAKKQKINNKGEEVLKLIRSENL